jgi:hypothetical protein
MKRNFHAEEKKSEFELYEEKFWKFRGKNFK